MKIFLNDCKSVATNKDGKCLSKTYINNKYRMTWECLKGHVWKAAYGDIIRGTWCPQCSGNIKYSIKFCKKIAKERGGRCISKVYENKRKHMTWKCKLNHSWEATFASVLRGSWCKICRNNEKKLTLQDCCEMAAKNNGKCLSKEYVGANGYMTWQCNLGHIWSAKYSKIQRGHWCHECSLAKTQAKIVGIIKEIFPKYTVVSNYRGFSWLKNRNGRRMEIDIYVPEIKLAIEYDGIQHFMPTRFGGRTVKEARAAYKKQIERDKIKNTKIYRHKNDVRYFIRFNYADHVNKELVIKKLLKKGIV